MVLDVGVEREPHQASSQKIFSKIEEKEVEGFISAASYPTLYYLLRKEIGPGDAREFLSVLSDLLSIVPVDKALLERAMQIRVEDYEDAVQIACAETCKADFIVTRDISGYKHATVKSLTPSEYLATY